LTYVSRRGISTGMPSTDKIQTLRCHHGDGHDWTRPAQRGKPPRFCPEHKPGRTDAQIARAMQRQATEGTSSDREIAKRDTQVTGGNEDADKLAKAREAAARAREERKAREAREAAQKVREELERINNTIDDYFAHYETALAKANRTNKVEDWNAADNAQARCIGMRTRQRTLENQVSA
jgi:hypothetical protein